VDARHPLTPLDRQLLEWHAASERPVLVLLTKADKLARSAAATALASAQSLLPRLHPAATAVLFSAVNGTGHRTAQNTIGAWLEDR
jgi:GTP-binding protein